MTPWWRPLLQMAARALLRAGLTALARRLDESPRRKLTELDIP